MKVTAIGRTRILFDTIRLLEESGHDVERIVTAEGEDFYGVSTGDFRRLAETIDAAFLIPDDINRPETVDTLRRGESRLAVSVNWPTLISEEVRDVFDHGIVNGHAGDLPRYRGNAAPNWAIINGEEAVVLTLHEMVDELDAGPILAQHHIPIDDTTYIGDIYDAMFERFPEMFVAVADDVESGDVEPEPQPSDPEEVLRGYPRCPVDSRVRWERSAEEIARIVRASAEPLFGAYTWLDTKKLRIWRAHPHQPAHSYLGAPGQVAERSQNDGTVSVVTGDGLLVLETVELVGGDGGRRDATAIIESSRARLGMDVPTAVQELRQSVEQLRDLMEQDDGQ